MVVILGNYSLGEGADPAPPDLFDPATRLVFDSRMAGFVGELEELRDDWLVEGLKDMGRMWRWMLREGI